MVVIGDQLYQLVIVPVMAPVPIAWVAVGFNVDDALAQDLRGLTRLDVSFLSRQGPEPWALQASTLPEAGRLPLLVDVAGGNFAPSTRTATRCSAMPSVTRILPLRTASRCRPSSRCCSSRSPRRSSRSAGCSVSSRGSSLLAVAISILASVLISRGIARPVRELADSARRIAAGDYSNAPADLATRRSATSRPRFARCRRASRRARRGSWTSPTATR